MESLLGAIPRPTAAASRGRGVAGRIGEDTGGRYLGGAPLPAEEKTKVNARRDQATEEPLWKQMDSAHGTTYYVDQKAYARFMKGPPCKIDLFAREFYNQRNQTSLKVVSYV